MNDLLKALPGSSGCFVCDNSGSNHRALKLNLLWHERNEEVHIPFTPDASWCGFKKVVHGGILAAVLDEAMAWAVKKKHNDWTFTADFHLRYKIPVELGRDYLVIGKVAQYNSRRIKALGRIQDLAGNIFAVSDGIFLPPAGQKPQAA